MEPLTVLCWLWSQPESRTRYSALHVNILRDMVARNMSLPHRFACVTDIPEGIDSRVHIIDPPRDFDDVRIPTWPEHRPQCLRRLTMFRRDAAAIFGERILCLDLDCVVGGDLSSLLDRAGDFRMAIGTAPGRPYNGSAIYLAAGSRPEVYERFTPEGAAEAGRKFVGSDQAWIAHCLPNEATWGEGDGLVYYGLPHNPASRRIMFFPGNEKPWMCGQDGWIGRNYRRSQKGRCLVLSYGGSLWQDTAAALDRGPYDAVIASPEAAEHWPGKILAVARDDMEAARLAHLHGFDDVTWCGREAA